ncbi:ATP-binding protein [Sphingobacterium hungaricum]|uniref:histidine kinase n=1 Tax=Sphingobacterium hungaricum TaxID=2082723 RepID=A0A928YRA4_9SPHI|nr:ATP-binding protein [Sphingobacterium hungaricum]MBE8714447.1 hypothetical protein [Sphingobacterium hungaricum]
MANIVNCEDEQIHIPNHVQSFGILCVFNNLKKLTYISENSVALTQDSYTKFFGISIEEFIQQHLPESSEAILDAIDQLHESKNGRTLQVESATTPFYLSMYELDGFLYLEFEFKLSERQSIPLALNYFDAIDYKKDLWSTLCSIVQEIIDFDRVMIYQFREDHSGKVIAEKVKDGLNSYMNFHYPEFDIPLQARALYTKKAFRIVPDINAPLSKIYSTSSEPLDLTLSNIRALSPIHLEYLKNAGVEASCSISIVIDGKLWGLVACQNEKPKQLDLFARNQAVALTKYAANKFINDRNALYAESSEILKSIELEIQSKSLLKNSVKEAIIESLGSLNNLLGAHGIAYIVNDTVFKSGIQENDTTILEISKRIAQQQRAYLYSTNNFSKDFKDEFEIESNSSGIVWIAISGTRKECILWFRQEQQQEITWAGNPEKILKPTQNLNELQVSPRTSFEAWKETVKGTAFPWSEKDIYIAESIRKIAVESALLKSEEIRSLNDELQELNYALDSYAYTISHDLKNPLSVLKLNAQMIIGRQELDPEFLKKRASLIVEGIDRMTDMISNILELSRSKSVEIELSIQEPKPIIEQLFEDCKINHQNLSCELELKQALPVYIERTMLYQIFSNLISNAVKYSSKAEEPKVIIDSYVEEPYTIYTIEDNGIGINPDEVGKIFNIFHRLSNAKEFKGSGVGLSIVQQIMKRLDGKISIHAADTGGSIFELRFLNA